MIDDRLRHRLVCVECGAVDDGRRGWRIYLDDEDQPVTFCPRCSSREFDA